LLKARAKKRFEGGKTDMADEKTSFLRSLTTRLNRRKLITSAAPAGVAGTLMGTLAIPAYAQEHSHLVGPYHGESKGGFKEIKAPFSTITSETWVTAWAISGGDFTFPVPINGLGGGNVVVSTTMSSYNGFGTAPSGSIYISDYSDASGIHHIDGTLGNILFITGATSVTLSISVHASYLAGFVEIKFFG
jgi:hypothetical protein